MQAQCTDRTADGGQRLRRVTWIGDIWLCEVRQASRASAPLHGAGERRRLETTDAREALRFLGGDEAAARLLREAHPQLDADALRDA